MLETWQAVIGTARNKLLTLPTKVAPRLQAQGTTADYEKVIREELYAILTELSDEAPMPKGLQT